MRQMESFKVNDIEILIFYNAIAHTHLKTT